MCCPLHCVTHAVAAQHTFIVLTARQGHVKETQAARAIHLRVHVDVVPRPLVVATKVTLWH